jgi:hypothetical protein
MDEIEVPDVAEPLTGWKVLWWTGTRLYSNGWTLWPYYEPVHAKCRFEERSPCDNGSECACGIYSYSTVEAAVGHLKGKDYYAPGGRKGERMVVRLELGGKFIPYQKGYRSEFAMVSGILDPGRALQRWLSAQREAEQEEARKSKNYMGFSHFMEYGWSSVVLPYGPEVREAAHAYDVPVLDFQPETHPLSVKPEVKHWLMGERSDTEADPAPPESESETVVPTRSTDPVAGVFLLLALLIATANVAAGALISSVQWWGTVLAAVPCGVAIGVFHRQWRNPR